MKFIAVVLSACIVAACGGGGGGGSPTPVVKVELHGVASSYKPVNGGTVEIRCDGFLGYSAMASTDSAGRWSANVPEQNLPCRLQVSGGDLPKGQTYTVIAAKAGIINITPLAELLVSMVLKNDPKLIFQYSKSNSVYANMSPNKIEENIVGSATKMQDMFSQIEGWANIKNVNPLESQFEAKDGDLAFELLRLYDQKVINHRFMMYLVSDGTIFTLQNVKNELSRQENTHFAWDAASVWLPGADAPTGISSLKSLSTTAPVAVGMHGCNGLGTMPSTWGYELAKLGYLVVMPDSVSRPDRIGRFTCQAGVAGVGNDDIWLMRTEEAHYSIRQVLRNASWWNGRKLLLFGHSEGGATVYGEGSLGNEGNLFFGVTAAIVSGYWCGSGNTIASIAPTLTVAYRNDPWYYGKPIYSGIRCWGGVEGWKSVVLDGAFHNAFDTDAGKAAVLDYAKWHLTQ